MSTEDEIALGRKHYEDTLPQTKAAQEAYARRQQEERTEEARRAAEIQRIGREYAVNPPTPGQAPVVDVTPTAVVFEEPEKVALPPPAEVQVTTRKTAKPRE